MKISFFSFFSCLTLASSFAFAAPALDHTLVDRATQSHYDTSVSILTSLYSEVKEHTAVMSESLCPTVFVLNIAPE